MGCVSPRGCRKIHLKRSLLTLSPLQIAPGTSSSWKRWLHPLPAPSEDPRGAEEFGCRADGNLGMEAQARLAWLLQAQGSEPAGWSQAASRASSQPLLIKPLCAWGGGARPAGASAHLEASTGPGQPARLTAAPPSATHRPWVNMPAPTQRLTFRPQGCLSSRTQAEATTNIPPSTRPAGLLTSRLGWNLNLCTG